MQTSNQDMFGIKADAICIPTNLQIKKDGKAVMGKGLAKRVADMYPEIPVVLADCIRAFPEQSTFFLGVFNGVRIFAFSTKTDWRQKADVNLIRRSARDLKRYIDGSSQGGHKLTVVLPQVGCGEGGLNWKQDVEPILREELREQNYIVSIYEPDKQITDPGDDEGDNEDE